MDSTVFSLLKKTLEHKFGRFFYETKLGKPPEPEDLIVKYGLDPKGEVEAEGPSPEFGGICDFIRWFEKEHGKDADLRWDRLMTRIKKLSDSKEGMIFIMQRISNLPLCRKVKNIGKIITKSYTRKNVNAIKGDKIKKLKNIKKL